jgi:hypothetical protein
MAGRKGSKPKSINMGNGSEFAGKLMDAWADAC